VRVLVTGATGNVGTAVMRALEADDRVDAVIGAARRVPDRASSRHVSVDVARDDLTPLLAGVDAVVHLAWKFQPVGAPVVTWQTNVIGSERVFRAAIEARVSTLVSASSVGAYSPAPPDDPERRVDESWPTHSIPTASYGREKAYVERLLDAVEARAPALRVVRLRPAFSFQPRAAAEQRRIFAGPFVPDRLMAGSLPVVPLPRDLHLQAVHADDVADAYRRALLSDARGAFNVATEPVLDAVAVAAIFGRRLVTVPRAAVKAAVAAGWYARILPVDPALVELFLSVPLMDATRARTELNWAPAHDASSALRAFSEGLAHHAGQDPPLERDSAGRRVRELRTWVGHRDPGVEATSV
jgi:nucleoside-diphosphate-sugar epimerase